MSDLDSIIMSVDCPRCGAEVHTTYGQLRLTGAFGCGCGALIRSQAADTDVAKVQALIDEIDPPTGAND